MAMIQTTTPDRLVSPQKQPISITEAQKQALIENLQLEVTERARKLRAQYALQAQGLRARLEMRINRIPQSMRKMKMEDLVNRHAQQQKPAPTSVLTQKHKMATKIASPAKLRGTKRQSDDYPIMSDKENSHPTTSVSNPKKRKPNPPTNSAMPPPSSMPSSSPAATRSTRKPIPTWQQSTEPVTILSPKSHNSRPSSRASPLKSPPSHMKSPPPSAFRFPAAPASARPATAPDGSTTKPARPASRTTKRPEPVQVASAAQLEGEQLRPTSSSSNSSANTTIVHSARKRPAPASKTTSTKVKKDVAPASNTLPIATTAAAAPTPALSKKGTIKSAFHSLTGSKRGKAAAAAAAAAAAKEAMAPTAPPTTGGRVLRKRA